MGAFFGIFFQKNQKISIYSKYSLGVNVAKRDGFSMRVPAVGGVRG